MDNRIQSFSQVKRPLLMLELKRCCSFFWVVVRVDLINDNLKGFSLQRGMETIRPRRILRGRMVWIGFNANGPGDAECSKNQWGRCLFWPRKSWARSIVQILEDFSAHNPEQTLVLSGEPSTIWRSALAELVWHGMIGMVWWTWEWITGNAEWGD